MHLRDDELRSTIDGELGAGAAERLQHLEGCETCQSRLAELKARAEFVAARLIDARPPQGTENGPRARVWERLSSRLSARKARVSWWRPHWSLGWGLAAAGVLLLGSLAFAPVRVWAGEFLGLFRVKQISVLPVDVTRLSELSGDTPFTGQLSRVLSSEIDMQRPAGEPRVVDTAEQASALLGFEVRLPAGRDDAPTLVVETGEAFTLTIDRRQAQGLLDELAPGKFTLPGSVDGAQVKVDIPAGLTAGYGDCPGLDNPESGTAADSGSPARLWVHCVMLVQLPSPTVSTPPDLDVAQLAMIGLQLTGMTEAQARDYSQAVDWTSTLVIPVPRNGASYETVSVDGVKGYLIERPADDAPQYVVVWTKGGIVYALGGLGSGGQAAVDLANTMP